jgi:hypothetical protein
MMVLAVTVILTLSGNAEEARTVAPGPLAFYVAPDGNDDAAGTAEKPFQTLFRARKAVREVNRHMKADVVIHLRRGTYHLSEPLVLTEKDSGHHGFAVVYRSADGPGQARLSGSRLLTGWERHEGDIWKIDTGSKRACHTLYENGRRVRKARFPNYEHDSRYPCAAGRYLVSRSGSGVPKKPTTRSFIIAPHWGLPPEDTDLQQLKVNVFPWGKANWHRWICEVIAVDRETQRVTFDNQGDGTEIEGRARYFYEDALALLDQPGEYFFDEGSGILYYWPKGEGHPDQLSITMPVTHDLIRIEGASREEPAEHIHIEGLRLEETDARSPTRFWWQFDWGHTDHALVWMRNTREVTIRDCHLKNSGRHGVMMAGENRHNTVAGCWIEQVGVNGITLSNRFPKDGTARSRADRLEHHLLTNNRIHDVGQLSIFNACVSLMNGSNNEVSYSEFFNSPRYAITLRGNACHQQAERLYSTRYPEATGNVFKYLRIHGCGQDGGDLGALHAAGVNVPGGSFINHWEQIVIENTRATPDMHDWPPDGIFLDWKSRTMHQVFRHIHISKAQGKSLRSNGPDNEASATFENVSWRPGFDASQLEINQIGLKPGFVFSTD